MSDIKIDGFNGTAKPRPLFCLSGTAKVSLNVHYMSSAGGLVVNTTAKARKEDTTKERTTTGARIDYGVSGGRTRSERQWKIGLLPGKASSFCWLFGLHSQWSGVSWQRWCPGAAPQQQPIRGQHAAHSRILGYFRHGRACTAVFLGPAQPLLLYHAFLSRLIQTTTLGLHFKN